MIQFLYACYSNTAKMVDSNEIFVNAIALKGSNIKDEVITNQNCNLITRTHLHLHSL